MLAVGCCSYLVIDIVIAQLFLWLALSGKDLTVSIIDIFYLTITGIYIWPKKKTRKGRMVSVCLTTLLNTEDGMQTLFPPQVPTPPLTYLHSLPF